jgi:hypothetical protein
VGHLKELRASNKHVGAIGGKAEATPEIDTFSRPRAHLGAEAVLAIAQGYDARRARCGAR